MVFFSFYRQLDTYDQVSYKFLHYLTNLSGEISECTFCGDLIYINTYELDVSFSPLTVTENEHVTSFPALSLAAY